MSVLPRLLFYKTTLEIFTGLFDDLFLSKKVTVWYTVGYCSSELHGNSRIVSDNLHWSYEVITPILQTLVGQ